VFEIGFAVEVDPEFAPDGGVAPTRIPQNLVRIGAVLRVTAPDAAPWDIAIGAPNWWRAPIASAIAFVSDGTGYLVDVVSRRVLVEIPDAVRVREDERHELLLFATSVGLTAVGRHGVAWQTSGAWPDLKVERIEADAIVCSIHDGTPRRGEVRFEPGKGIVLA